jgi:hypothetical protein
MGYFEHRWAFGNIMYIIHMGGGGCGGGIYILLFLCSSCHHIPCFKGIRTHHQNKLEVVFLDGLG